MNKEEFIKELKRVKIILNEKQLEQLDVYANFLIEYNKVTNLTALKDFASIYLKHFFDCLIIIKYYDFKEVTNLLDVGTGAGFPGLVLKILFPDLEVTLLESNNKKIKFLNSLIIKLSLKKVNLVQDRAENYIKEKREKYDLVIARAVADLKILVELCLPFVEVGKDFLAMKGNATLEIEESLAAIELLGGQLKKVSQFYLPLENSSRSLIVIKKINPTNTLYPREYDKIIKKPLKKIYN